MWNLQLFLPGLLKLQGGLIDEFDSLRPYGAQVFNPASGCLQQWAAILASHFTVYLPPAFYLASDGPPVCNKAGKIAVAVGLSRQ
jgi:hypothetical protein